MFINLRYNMNRRIFVIALISLVALNVDAQNVIRYANRLCGVSITKEVSKEFMRASIKNETEKINKLIVVGYVLVIEKGTKVEIVSRGLLESKIKILQGAHKAKEGYVENEFIRDAGK